MLYEVITIITVKTPISYKLVPILVLKLLSQSLSGEATTSDTEGPITDLEAFIVRETSEYSSGTIEPMSRSVTGLFNADMTVMA